jgi:hypothetical protein
VTTTEVRVVSVRAAISGLFVGAVIVPQSPSPQRPPIFRAGAHYVRVDAYPSGKDGHVVNGLTIKR